MTLKPWREVAVPHEDVLRGTFQQAEFAADLSKVHTNPDDSKEYGNPVSFFKRTFITEGMRLLLESVLNRITGKGGDPVIQLQTAFGGGKTHTMLAVYHMVRGTVPAAELNGVSPILDAAGIIELPWVRVVVIDGTKLSPNMPNRRGNVDVRTMWGDIAWQLGGEEAYERIRQADESGTSPGKETVAKLLNDYSPCVILMDELVAYVRQFEDKRTYTGGTYESNITFMQVLTEALKAAPTAILLASLPESDQEAGGKQGVKALHTLEHYFGRVQALWKPVAAEEAFEIVRRRLFSEVVDTATVEEVCRAFANLYIGEGYPQETQSSQYYHRLVNAYPVHPEVFDRLYEDWSSLENFQRTRGVLKLMAKVIHRQWKDGNNDLLIMPGNLPLYDGNIRNEMIYYLPQGWDPVVERDIDGDRAEATEIDDHNPRFGSVQAGRRVARTIFLGSAPGTTNRMAKGIEEERVMLGSIQPGQQTSVFKDVLRRLSDRLYYLNGDDRYWFDTRPNLRREMEERKKRFDKQGDVIPVIRDSLTKSPSRGIFDGVHVFTPHADVPDDSGLRLVVLPPDAHHGKGNIQMASVLASEYLKKRGEQPRHRQNRLIFLAAGVENVNLLIDNVRSMLAWKSIVSDYQNSRLVLDNLMAKSAEDSLETARRTVERTLKDTYHWLLVPIQEAVDGRVDSNIVWESYEVNSGAGKPMEEIERVLKENEALITEWSPIHLSNLLKRWFWNSDVPEITALEFWDSSCRYLYLPRLLNKDVLKRTIEAGADRDDYFGLSAGKDGERYVDFSYGKEKNMVVVDESLLLIDPFVAESYRESVKLPEESKAGIEVGEARDTSSFSKQTEQTSFGTDHIDTFTKSRFYGCVKLDPIKAKLEFSTIVDEVIAQFTQRPTTEVIIRVEIDATDKKGFDENHQRAVKENSNTLRFESAEFEKE